MLTALLLNVFTFLVAGCGPEGEIVEYTVTPENERIVTSDVLKDEFGVMPFEWDLPKSWTQAKNDQFSKIAWEVGPESDRGRITVSDVSMGMGLVSQLERWRGQINMAAPEDPMTGTQQLDLNGTAATYVDFTGEQETILGMMFTHGSKLWVFKFRASNAVADEARVEFRSFCESVKIAG